MNQITVQKRTCTVSYSDIESKLPDNLPDDNKVNLITTTGEDLTIDENTAQNPDNISNNK